MKRYLIDKLAEGMLESAAAAIAKATKKSKKPIHSVLMWRDSSETFIPFTALIFFSAGKPRGFAGHDLRLLVLPPTTFVPSSLYAVEGKGDLVRAEFIKANKLKKTDDWWGDVLSVPRLLVGIEMDRVFSRLKDVLEEVDVKLAPKFVVYSGDPDATEPIKESRKLDRAVASDLKKKLKTAAQKQAFAELCYHSKDRQAWLLKLAGT
jgi:hypothetical protein